MPDRDASGSDADQGVFVFSRSFDAPRDLVWRAWTELERLNGWWGPKGFEMLHSSLDLRPDGEFRYGMRSPEGHEMWGKWVFHEITPPTRLTFVDSFTDAEGAIIRAPFNADFPQQILSVVELSDENGRTTVHLRGEPINASDTERATFAGMRDSMQQGWTGTADQLETYLAEQPNEVAR